MFSQTQINNMNYDTKYSSSPWITITENTPTDVYKLYPMNNMSISTGREYIALPADKVLTASDFSKYNISK